MIGIIGGSGLYNLEGARLLSEEFPDTPFGKPSAPILIAELEGRNIAFLSRHGKDHSYPPHLVPYRANLWALRSAGVEQIVAISAVGSINRRFYPGDFVIIDSFLDFTRSRPSTFFEGRFSKQATEEWKTAELMRNHKVVHIDVSEPYCPRIRKVILELLEELGLPHHPAGTYACTEGPRFETPAEIKMLEAVGADVVGMTGVPEVVLAKELQMCYASLCVVANPAAGISEGRLTSDEVIDMMKGKEEEIKSIITLLIKRLEGEITCNCKNSLEGAEV